MEREDHRSAITVSSSSPVFSILQRERDRFIFLPCFFLFCRGGEEIYTYIYCSLHSFTCRRYICTVGKWKSKLVYICIVGKWESEIFFLVPFGWYANYELRTLETYYFIASLRSSRHKRHAVPFNEMFQDVLPEWKGFSCPNGIEVHRHNSDLASELHELKHIHSYYAYAKSLSKCDFIKLDSDFEEIFQRLKSENRWPEQSDDFLRALLENHFSILHEVNDNSSVMDVCAGNRLEENRLLEAINKRYAKEFGDTTKNYEELWINEYFVPHMKYKSMVQKNLDQARVLRTEYIPQESHLTTQKRFELKNRALVAKGWIVEKLSQMKGRAGGQYRGPGTGRVPGLLLVFASLTAWLALDSRGKEQV